MSNRIANTVLVAFAGVVVGILVDQLILVQVVGFSFGAFLGACWAGYWVTARLKQSARDLSDVES